MRAVIQRVEDAFVVVGEHESGRIREGVLVYLGVEDGDSQQDLEYVVRKVSGARIFPDHAGVMNVPIEDLPEPELLVVSQFTLLGDLREGRRPSYHRAAAPERAKELYEKACDSWQRTGISVQRGVFQANMRVNYTNVGPVTILIDSRKEF